MSNKKEIGKQDDLLGLLGELVDEVYAPDRELKSQLELDSESLEGNIALLQPYVDWAVTNPIDPNAEIKAATNVTEVLDTMVSNFRDTQTKISDLVSKGEVTVSPALAEAASVLERSYSQFEEIRKSSPERYVALATRVFSRDEIVKKLSEEITRYTQEVQLLMIAKHTELKGKQAEVNQKIADITSPEAAERVSRPELALLKLGTELTPKLAPHPALGRAEMSFFEAPSAEFMSELELELEFQTRHILNRFKESLVRIGLSSEELEQVYLVLSKAITSGRFQNYYDVMIGNHLRYELKFLGEKIENVLQAAYSLFSSYDSITLSPGALGFFKLPFVVKPFSVRFGDGSNLSKTPEGELFKARLVKKIVDYYKGSNQSVEHRLELDASGEYVILRRDKFDEDRQMQDEFNRMFDIFATNAGLKRENVEPNQVLTLKEQLAATDNRARQAETQLADARRELEKLQERNQILFSENQRSQEAAASAAEVPALKAKVQELEASLAQAREAAASSAIANGQLQAKLHQVETDLASARIKLDALAGLADNARGSLFSKGSVSSDTIKSILEDK